MALMDGLREVIGFHPFQNPSLECNGGRDRHKKFIGQLVPCHIPAEFHVLRADPTRKVFVLRLWTATGIGNGFSFHWDWWCVVRKKQGRPVYIALTRPAA